MELMDVILKRRSVRKYADQAIPEDTLKKILQAGLLAPTSRNLKPCEFYVIRDKDLLSKLSQVKSGGAGMLAGCGAAVVVFGDSEKADTWVEDCSIAISYMMLTAEEQGVSNCWVQIHFRSDSAGNEAEKNVRELFSLPEKYRIAGILSLGIAAETPEPHSPEDADWNKVHYF
ncbi:MAG: nitroreductase family protein [Oscillospiraceae bacterium]|nr:nitroreductase family protein [Oscillospiraceae bacterium]